MSNGFYKKPQEHGLYRLANDGANPKRQGIAK
jgi:hypothetical protein